MHRSMLPLAIVFTFILYAESIETPSQMRLSLLSACEVAMLHTKPSRKSPVVSTRAHNGTTVDVLGCKRLRDTAAILEECNTTKRDYLLWKYPIWCKVRIGNKVGWIRRQFLR